MIAYAIEFSLILALLGSLHFILLRESKSFRFLRIYITGGIILAGLLPFLPPVMTSNLSVLTGMLPVIEISNGAALPELLTESYTYTPWKLVFFLYGFVTIGFLTRFIYSLSKISSIINRSQPQIINGQKLRISSEISDPCSFLDHILLPPLADVQEPTLKTILSHELLHITYKHTYEKLFWEVLSIFLWWHPATWYLRQQITLTHEYQVDAAMTDSIVKSNYQNILIELVIKPYNLSLVNPITSNIKKRIKMMNSNKKFQSSKYFLLGLMLITGAFIIHSCQEELSMEEKSAEMSDTQFSNEYKALLDEFVIDTTIVLDTETLQETMKLDKRAKQSKPQFPGCDANLDFEAKSACSNQKLLEFVYKQVKYPKTSKEKKEEGMVVAKIAINETGVIDFYEIIRTPSEDLKAAVAKVLDKMQREIIWTPGEIAGIPTKAEFILPVKFKLN